MNARKGVHFFLTAVFAWAAAIFFCLWLHEAGNIKYVNVPIEPEKPITIVLTQSEHGKASWYGEPEHGQIRADGEVYDMYDMHTAAHSTLPLGTIVIVTNLNNGKSIVVQINDKLPKVWNKDGRIIDMSFAAAQEIKMIYEGIVPVELSVITSSKELTPRILHNKYKDIMVKASS